MLVQVFESVGQSLYRTRKLFVSKLLGYGLHLVDVGIEIVRSFVKTFIEDIRILHALLTALSNRINGFPSILIFGDYWLQSLCRGCSKYFSQLL